LIGAGEGSRAGVDGIFYYTIKPFDPARGFLISLLFQEWKRGWGEDFPVGTVPDLSLPDDPMRGEGEGLKIL